MLIYIYIPDLRATLIIPLRKFVSSRSLNLKYFAPPMIDMINRGFGIFQASRRILSTFSLGVSKSSRAY